MKAESFRFRWKKLPAEVVWNDKRPEVHVDVRNGIGLVFQPKKELQDRAADFVAGTENVQCPAADDVQNAVAHAHRLPPCDLPGLCVEAVPDEMLVRQQMVVLVDALPGGVGPEVQHEAIWLEGLQLTE